MRTCVVIAALLVCAQPLGAELFTGSPSSDSVRVFCDDADGDAPPLRALTGGGLHSPQAIAVDRVAGELYVANFEDPPYDANVSVYPMAGEGETSPLRVISGPATELTSSTRTLIVDRTDGELYVISDSVQANPVVVHALDAKGNAVPLRQLGGPLTGLTHALGAVLDEQAGELYIVNDDLAGASIRVFDPQAAGDALPKRVISGPSTGLGHVRAIAIDPGAGELYVAILEGTILVFSQFAAGDVQPLRSISGPHTGMSSITALLKTPTEILTGGGSGVLAFAADATGDAAPVRSLATGSMSMASTAAIDGGDFVVRDEALIFSDGFESCALGAWSGSYP